MNDNTKFILTIILLFTCIVFVYWQKYSSYKEANISTREIPGRISEWISEDVDYDRVSLSTLGSDKIIYKTYRKINNIPITLFVAYYNTMEKADLSHSPIVCFTGQGWEITDSRKRVIPVNITDTKSIEVNELIQKKTDAMMITLFWYQSDGRAFSNRGIQKILLLLRKTIGKTDENAFIRLTASIPVGGNIEELQSNLYQFVHDVYPYLGSYLFGT